MDKPRLSFWHIWNMSFGFMGIQFGWGLQLANMSPIYEKLGAAPDEIPILWLAAPMTGLVVQPIIGFMSDRTWNRLGRRRPYFLVGAILASTALFFMPRCSALWMAAGLLWILDASINISMEPFRAFVADKLNRDQRTVGFVMQSFFIGVGASLANAMPYLLRQLGMTGETASGIPLAVKLSFEVGAVVFLLAVVWTVVTTAEYPPEEVEVFRRMQHESRGHFVRELFSALREMPSTMKELAVVQLFTWLGLFCMWMFFGVSTARHVFGAADATSPQYNEGTAWGGVAFAVYSLVTFVVAFALPRLATVIGRRVLHALSLVVGGVGLLSVSVIRDPYVLLLTMVGVGIAWASILSMPYAILAGAIPPARMGIYMGVFNFFIVIPEIVAALTFQPLVRHVFGNDPLYVVMLGGGSLLVAALLMLRVREAREIAAPALWPVAGPASPSAS